MKHVAAVALSLAAFTHAGAVERTWVGASGGVWTDAANWDPAGTPDSTDTLVFKPDGDLVVRIGNGDSNCQGGGFRFESGSTVFAYTNSSKGIYLGNVSNFFYVAEDATATISNIFRGVTALNKTGRFIKTGKGDLYVQCYSGDAWYNSPATTVLAGIDFV